MQPGGRVGLLVRLTPAVGVGRRRRSGGNLSPRTIWGVTVDAYDAETNSLSLTVNSDAASGDVFYVVITPAADAAPSAAQVRAGQNHSGGAPLEADSYSYGATSFILSTGIANQSARLHVAIDRNNSGVLSNVATTDPFTIDTTAPSITASSFTDNGAAGIARSVTFNEAVDYRWSVWNAGTNPTNAELRDGTDALFTGTATASANVPVTGTVNTGAGSFQMGTYGIDALGNEVFASSDTITVSAASDARETTPVQLGWYSSDSTVRSGNDVTEMTDKVSSGPIHLTARPNPPFTNAMQQASAGAIITFSAPSGIQSASSAAANRRAMQELLTGGSIRVFMAVDLTNLAAGNSIFYAENETNDTNQSIFFGASLSGGTVRLNARGKRNSDAFVFDAHNTGLTASQAGLCIIEYLVTQTVARGYRNGTQVGGDVSVTASNFPNASTCLINIGGRASTTAIAQAASGALREIYVTGTTDDTTAGAIRAAMADQWGITL